eukprot:ANDGO_07200.mRNA.1 Putative metal ion transporter C17A12.14
MTAHRPDTDRVEINSLNTSESHSQGSATLFAECAGEGNKRRARADGDTYHGENATSEPNCLSIVDPSNSCSNLKHHQAASVLNNRDIDGGDIAASLLSKGSRVMYVGSSLVDPPFYDSCRDFTETHSELFASCPFDRLTRECHWIDVQTTDRSDFLILGSQLSLHELTMENCMSGGVVEISETFACQRYSYLSILVQQGEDDDLEHCAPIHVILFNDKVITVHSGPIPCLAPVLTRLRFKGFDMPFDILYAILDAFVDEAVLLTDAVLSDCESIEDLVFSLSESQLSDLLLRISNSRKKLVALRQHLTGKQNIVSQLSSSKWQCFGIAYQDMGWPPANSQANFVSTNNVVASEMLSEDDYPIHGRQSSDNRRLYLRDLQNHINSCLHKIERSREMLSHSHSNYLSRVSISVARTSQTTNNWMKRLGIVATGVLPLTLVTSAFGMNVQVPWQHVESTDPFYGILAATCTFAFSLTAAYAYRTYGHDRPGAGHAVIPPV